jgi:hypothetical protein
MTGPPDPGNAKAGEATPAARGTNKTDDRRRLPCCPNGCNRALALRTAQLLPVPFTPDDRALWVTLSTCAAQHTWADVIGTLARSLHRSCEARREARLFPPSSQLTLPLD